MSLTTTSKFIHIPRTGGHTIHKIIGTKHKGTCHNKWWDPKYLASPKRQNEWRYCFIRNPWGRIASLYALSVENEWEEQKSFYDFIHPKLYLHAQHEYWIHSNFIGSFENFETDLIGLLEQIGIEYTKKVPWKNKKLTGHYSNYYDAKTIDLVAKLEAKTIKRFGYEFEDIT